MITVEDILKDTSTFAYRNVVKVADKDQLYKLVFHPDPCVRLAAAKLAPVKHLICFLPDPGGDASIENEVWKRLTAHSQKKVSTSTGSA